MMVLPLLGFVLVLEGTAFLVGRLAARLWWRP